VPRIFVGLNRIWIF